MDAPLYLLENARLQGIENPQAALQCEGGRLREPEILRNFRAAH
jgi:hypothetical protein